MKERTLRGKVAIVGVGETAYYRHGRAPDPEFALALQAVLRACEDAGIDPRRVDGFASYSNDRELPHADDVRMIGNLLGDPEQDVRIGAPVEAAFEPHDEAKPPYTLVALAA